MPRRIAAYLLLFSFLAIGSGIAEWAHDWQHDQEDARIAADLRAAGKPVPPPPVHDESNCPTCAQLHMPFVSGAQFTPPLICLGLLLAILKLRPVLFVSQRVPIRLDCRGPPLA